MKKSPLISSVVILQKRTESAAFLTSIFFILYSSMINEFTGVFGSHVRIAHHTGAIN